MCIRDSFWAARTGNLAQVKKLVAAGVDVNAAENEINLKPILLASRDHQWEVVNYLLDRGAQADPVSTRTGDSPLRSAVLDGPTDLVRRLLEKGADPLRLPYTSCVPDATPIHWAASQGSTDKLELLIKAVRRKGGDLEGIREGLYERALSDPKINYYETVKVLILSLIHI